MNNVSIFIDVFIECTMFKDSIQKTTSQTFLFLKIEKNYPTIPQCQVAACPWVGNPRVNLDSVRLEISRRGSAKRERGVLCHLGGLNHMYI